MGSVGLRFLVVLCGVPEGSGIVRVDGLPDAFENGIAHGKEFVRGNVPPLNMTCSGITGSANLVELNGRFLCGNVGGLMSGSGERGLVGGATNELVGCIGSFGGRSLPDSSRLKPAFPFGVVRAPEDGKEGLPRGRCTINNGMPGMITNNVTRPLNGGFFCVGKEGRDRNNVSVNPDSGANVRMRNNRMIRAGKGRLGICSTRPVLGNTDPTGLIVNKTGPSGMFGTRRSFGSVGEVGSSKAGCGRNNGVCRTPSRCGERVTRDNSVVVSNCPAVTNGEGCGFVGNLAGTSEVNEATAGFVGLNERGVCSLTGGVSGA